MELTKLERLMLINQYDILEKLNPEESEFYSVYKEILINGYTHNYDELIEYLHDDVPEEISKEVWDILQMHRSLIFSFDNLEDKGDFDEKNIKFRGFDGNNETIHMSYTRFVIHDLESYDELRDEHRNYNSHWPMLDKYRRMVSVWQSISERYNSNLSLEEIKRIINV